MDHATFDFTASVVLITGGGSGISQLVPVPSRTDHAIGRFRGGLTTKIHAPADGGAGCWWCG